MTDEWTTVSHKKNKNIKNNDNHVYNSQHQYINTEFQNWKPLIIKGGSYQEKKPLPNINNTIRKSTANKDLTIINESKIEKNIEEGNLTHKKISLNLQLKIQKARLEKNLTQEELANKCQIPLKDIRDYEKGISIPDHNKLNKIAKILEIKLKD